MFKFFRRKRTDYDVWWDSLDWWGRIAARTIDREKRSLGEPGFLRSEHQWPVATEKINACN